MADPIRMVLQTQLKLRINLQVNIQTIKILLSRNSFTLSRILKLKDRNIIRPLVEKVLHIAL